jgi:hypothetical protein
MRRIPTVPSHWQWTTALLGCCAIAGCGAGEDDPLRQEPDLVAAYCSYGASSSAELVSCAEQVTPGQVLRYDTNAARYARGELDRCLADAGPFCRSR